MSIVHQRTKKHIFSLGWKFLKSTAPWLIEIIEDFSPVQVPFQLPRLLSPKAHWNMTKYLQLSVRFFNFSFHQTSWAWNFFTFNSPNCIFHRLDAGIYVVHRQTSFHGTWHFSWIDIFNWTRFHSGSRPAQMTTKYCRTSESCCHLRLMNGRTKNSYFFLTESMISFERDIYEFVYVFNQEVFTFCTEFETRERKCVQRSPKKSKQRS